MIEKIITFIKQNYDWLFDLLLIVVLAAAIIHMVTCHSDDTARTAAKHIEAVTSTQTIEKEVKTNAETVRQTQSDNDRRVRQAVKKAADDIPTDLAALVDMANAIIRSCNSNQ